MTQEEFLRVSKGDRLVVQNREHLEEYYTVDCWNSTAKSVIGTVVTVKRRSFSSAVILEECPGCAWLPQDFVGFEQDVVEDIDIEDNDNSVMFFIE